MHKEIIWEVSSLKSINIQPNFYEGESFLIACLFENFKYLPPP